MQPLKAVLAIVLSVCAGPIVLYGQNREIDVNKSSLRVHVLKSGLLSAFAHNHEIEAPIDEGTIDSSARPSIQFRVDARKMHVLDPEVSADNRAEIQQTMESPSVLDSGHFSEISFQSTSIVKKGDAGWEVRGDLTLHGQKRPIYAVVFLQGANYRGSASLKQSSFGIAPIRIAGGGVKVKDEVKIEFNIVAVQ